jgi:hypothetical protein
LSHAAGVASLLAPHAALLLDLLHAQGVERVVVALVLAAVAVAVALVVQRRQRQDAPVRTGYAVPEQVDRGDFDRPEVPWLVVVFTSATCSTCAGVWEKAAHLGSDHVAVQEVEVAQHRDLHERYRVEAVPTVVVCDRLGVVRASFLGPVTATDLWATVAELREPGSTPESCHLDPGASGR